MMDETWRRLETFHARQPYSLAGPVPPEEVDAASADLGLAFPPDYREFLLRYGGGTVGFLPILGLRVVEGMRVASTVVEANRRYRIERWPGVDSWLIVTCDHVGSPVGIAPDGRMWRSERDGRRLTVEANDFKTLLSEALDIFLDGPHPWRPFDPAVVARPVRPDGCLVLLALSEASRYDIWDRPVIVQTLWSETLVECVHLTPLHGAVMDPAPSQTQEPGPVWRIEVRRPCTPGSIPEVAVIGRLGPLAPGFPKAMLARAVLIVAKQLAWQRGELRWPMIVGPSGTHEDYGVRVEELPLRHGGVWYGVSRDLGRYRMVVSNR